MFLALVRQHLHLSLRTNAHYCQIAAWGSVVVNWYVIRFFNYGAVNVSSQDLVSFGTG
jgi:hypothetical protein